LDATLLGFPDAGGEGFYGAEAEIFVETHGVCVNRSDGEREGAVAVLLQSGERRFHQPPTQTVFLITRQDADLRSVPNSGSDSGSQHHANGFFSRARTNNEGGFREELTAAGKQNDVAQKFHGTELAAILVVDLCVNVIGIGALDQARARFEAAVGPGFDAQAVL